MSIEQRDCPICVEIRKREEYGRIRRFSRSREWRPIRLRRVLPATHGAGGPGGYWSACEQHYEVISAFEWLRMTKKFEPFAAEGVGLSLIHI